MTPTQCPQCSTPPASGDLFCENCGFDFITESSPEHEADTPSPAAETASALATVEVAVDAEHHRYMDPDGQLTLPDPVPEPASVTLAPASLIGRRSQSRGVYPEIDASTLTGDPATSSRHAMLRRREDGTWVVADLSSTNGTYLRRNDDDPTMLDPGVEVSVDENTTILVGAWTSIRLRGRPELQIED